MNDQHTHAGYVGYDGYATGSFDTDPLFGALPGNYEAGHSGQYDSTQWDTGSHTTSGYGTYDAQPVEQHAQAQHPQQTQQFPQYDTTGPYETSAAQYDTTGQWDASAWNQANQTGQFETAAATFAYGATGQWAVPANETGTYDATAWNTGAEAVVPQQFTPEHEHLQEFGHEPGHQAAASEYESAPSESQQDFSQDFQPEFTAQFETEQFETAQFETVDFEAVDFKAVDFEAVQFEAEPELDSQAGPDAEFDIEAEPEETDGAESESAQEDRAPEPIAAVATARPVRRSGGSRGRRRTPAKRSALLTVAVPSACVMGVAGVAAASVGGLGTGADKNDATSLAAADPSSVQPVAANNKMDTQLAALSADARDFGDRASRTQERIDLKARQEAEKQKREDEAKRREALRPKFVLPVKQEGLSAYYGQAGVNWMSVHTGIDFPVSYGTKVMAATDGTVRTQWNSAYGNMAIVTAPDGTETWYCHLSSTKIRSGSVKAGDVIAYSGNSGNSTGPHLHFEVRPGGGSAIDPLPWLRSHGLDPT
ncbi:M23 family metallopeptidase [Streptomyces sp. NBC_00829]|uniref:M23 family metallopeptidase n=1 Tax=Streptomyces sp. NBC_00829 TaxID=2903679 RepID=UPI003865BE41|nr:peptidoglycan DD-metalloendopeptidase family protein [Streptomyces sp. NBC_00829]